MTLNSNTFDRSFFPMLVSSKQGVKDDPDEVVARWREFKTLPEKSRLILLSKELQPIIMNMARSQTLSTQQVEEVSRIIRELFFGKIAKDRLVNEILRRMSGIAPEAARFIAEVISNKIMNLEVKRSSNLELPGMSKLPISLAIQKYPRVGEQLITSNPIQLRIFPSPVRPSIKNWIADYHQNLGAKKHGTMERGNYLYHSQNAKRLSPGERQKLAIVLRSLDEDEPLNIDTEKQEVIFAAPSRDEYGNVTSPQMKATQLPPQPKITFSSGQRMPLEQRGFGFQPMSQSQQGAAPKAISEAEWRKEEAIARGMKGSQGEIKEAWQKNAKTNESPVIKPFEGIEDKATESTSETQAPKAQAPFREAWEKKESALGEPQARSGPIKATERRFWQGVYKSDFRPYRITPFGFDPSEAAFRIDKDNLSDLGDKESNSGNPGNVINLKQ